MLFIKHIEKFLNIAQNRSHVPGVETKPRINCFGEEFFTKMRSFSAY